MNDVTSLKESFLRLLKKLKQFNIVFCEMHSPEYEEKELMQRIDICIDGAYNALIRKPDRIKYPELIFKFINKNINKNEDLFCLIREEFKYPFLVNPAALIGMYKYDLISKEEVEIAFNSIDMAAKRIYDMINLKLKQFENDPKFKSYLNNFVEGLSVKFNTKDLNVININKEWCNYKNANNVFSIEIKSTDNNKIFSILTKYMEEAGCSNIQEVGYFSNADGIYVTSKRNSDVSTNLTLSVKQNDWAALGTSKDSVILPEM